MLLRLTVHFLISIVFMKNGQKNGQNGVTHSAHFSARHHWHNANQKKRAVKRSSIKRVKRRQV